MVKCIYENCKTCAHYGVKNGNPLYCYFHKIEGSFFINSRKCVIGDCTSVPYYGYKDDKFPTYCRIHKTTEMSSFHRHICKNSGCGKNAIFGYTNSKRRMYCIDHKLDSMELIISNTNNCTFLGCNNTRGSNKSYKLCDFHAPAEKEDYTKCITVYCKFIPSFGYKEGNPICCALHKHNDMIYVVTPTMELDTKKISDILVDTTSVDSALVDTTSVDTTSVDSALVDTTLVDSELNTALLLFNSLASQTYYKEDVYEDEEVVWISKKELTIPPKKRVRFKI